MAKWTEYFKIVEPKPNSVKMQDSQDLSGGSLYMQATWYKRLVSGSSTRLTRYAEYDSMDEDVDVTRALDVIAEEMTGNTTKTDMPLEIDLFDEDTTRTPETQVSTLRAALRYWCQIHDWENRLFKVARHTIKYGDCFFYKKNPHKKWIFMHPKHVLAAIVSEDDVTDVQGYQLRTEVRKPKNLSGYASTVNPQTDSKTKIVGSDEFVCFSLNDDMSDSAPFGESILRSVYRTHKQKELLEDSIIIYRVTRAPERRVFYIDVGKMPPQRVKQYLEGIKNEIRQKKIPTNATSATGQTSSIESVYNPQSAQEDFFFAQRPDGRGSRVETLPGGQGLGELSDLEYFQDKVYRGLRIPSSYMKSGQENALFNDGRVGQAYIEELRFALYIMRLQGYIERILDEEFKRYLRASGIYIDESSYRIRLPEPSNFGTYKQQEVDAALINSLTTADGVAYLSKRFILSRYLQLEDEEIIMNEKMLREEKGVDEKDPDFVMKLYGETEAGGGELGGFGSEMTAGGGELGGGEVGGAPGEATGGAGGEELTP